MQPEGVSAPLEAPALVPAPVPTVDTLAHVPVPVPGPSFGCGIAALLYPSFSRNRFHVRTVVLDRSHCVSILGGVIAEGEGERSTTHPVTVISNHRHRKIKMRRGTTFMLLSSRQYALSSRRYPAPSLMKLDKNRAGARHRWLGTRQGVYRGLVAL